MLTFFGSTQGKMCDGLSRRSFLKIGTLGIGGLSMADLLRCQAQGAADVLARPKAVIMVYLHGGPSHLDMYDLKPDAPVEIRGEFKPIRTKVPGVNICELMPLQAQIADRLAIIRNLRFPQASQKDDHCPPALFSGFPQESYRPALGSVIGRLRSDAGLRSDLPAFVLLSYKNDIPYYRPEVFPAYLGPAHQPFMMARLESLSLAKNMSLERLEDRTALLRSFDTINRQIDDSRGALTGMDAFTRQALAMISTGRTRDAFDLDKEPIKVRESYGPFTDFLRARRLVEAGVPVVTLVPSAPRRFGGGWDHHGNIFPSLRTALPLLDRAVFALINDLHARGLDQDVAVVIWGEMGRTPKVNVNGGRDHWNQAGFALVAGGGLKMGQVIGATTAKGEHPAGNHYTPQNVLATLYHVLGVTDVAQTAFADHSGRPVHLLDDPTKIAELV